MYFTTSVTILLYVEKYNVYETFDFNIINMTNRWKDNFYVYHFLLLTVDVCQFLRLSAKVLVVLWLTVIPIETLLTRCITRVRKTSAKTPSH